MIVVKYDDLFVCFIIYIIQLFYLYKRKVKCTHYKTKKKNILSIENKFNANKKRFEKHRIWNNEKKQELIMNFMNEVYYPIELAADFKKKLFLFDFD